MQEKVDLSPYLDSDLEDRTWDDDSKHAEVCHTHSQLLSDVHHLDWKKLVKKDQSFFYISYLFCMSEQSFLGQRDRYHQLWWHYTHHKCNMEHIGSQLPHILNIVWLVWAHWKYHHQILPKSNKIFETSFIIKHQTVFKVSSCDRYKRKLLKFCIKHLVTYYLWFWIGKTEHL